MVKLTIDQKEYEIDAEMSVLQACEQAGIEIPRFCYHERLSIAGNCRMCLVAMKNSPKPVASCTMPVADGMVISTNSPEVQKMRRSVMEFLLINHPLDCPICDQGGECDLQDQAMAYGWDGSRFQENKRAVKDKEFGPLVKTIMTRCIHCTRCVRFASEIAGVPELGLVGRGENVEIATYVEQALTSELSGNMIDLCPVGALTNKPYAFHARSWELKKTESVDVMDAIGSNIRIDTRGSKVMRILPRINELVNEEWISDKSRFACDGLSRQRLDNPYLRRNGRLVKVTWEEAFNAIALATKRVNGDEIAAIAGDLADCEAMTALKDLMSALGSPNIDCRQDGAHLDASVRSSYIFNSTISGIDRASALLLVGTDPRSEAPVLNARIRKRWALGSFAIGSIGCDNQLSYPVTFLGDTPKVLEELNKGKHSFSKTLIDAERPMIILGQGALARPDGATILFRSRQIAEKYGAVNNNWNGFNILHKAAARVGGLDLGFVPQDGGLNVTNIIEGARNGSVKIVYLLGADEINTSNLGKAFVIYQGHHGDVGANRADVILPGAAYTEKNATYVNTEGRVQLSQLATFPPGEAREDWTIIRALSEVLGHTLPFDNLRQLRARMLEINSIFLNIDQVAPAVWKRFGSSGRLENSQIKCGHSNFYMTDPISRASETMAQCTDTFLRTNQGKTGTDG
ncbi:MAG: NADH-quinone oxidoreductase subunit G [Magnetovibrio sp.]|nr:NADH-quinone oxidoreductase subunit G [Magnetovibrio sp.]